MRYTVGNKDNFILTLKNDYSYDVLRYGYHNTYDVAHIYTFEDEEGQQFVWKTTGNKFGTYETDEDFCGLEGKVILKGTVKEISTYRGREQVVLTRCSVRNILDRGMTAEEYNQFRIDNQNKSITEKDGIKTVTYKEYKENYSDYETVIDSFIRTANGCFIDVIIRG